MSGIVDDVRKVIQDLVTPDLKAIEARVVALDKTTDLRLAAIDGRFSTLERTIDTRFAAQEKSSVERFAALEKTIDSRFSAQLAIMNAKHDLVLAEVRTLAGIVASNHASVLHALDLDRRVERMENERSASRYVKPETLEAAVSPQREIRAGE